MSQTDDNFITSVTVHPDSLSDHHRIELKLRAQKPAVQTNTITKRDFRNIDADALRSDITSVCSDMCACTNDRQADELLPVSPIASTNMPHGVRCGYATQHHTPGMTLTSMSPGIKSENRRMCGEEQNWRFIDNVDEASEELERGNQEDTIVLDFEKAFDKVSHTLLVHKLRRYGIGGRLNAWIDSFLENRQQAVVVGGERSNFMPVNSGVRQGSVVGPCLFLLYINDLPIEIESKIRLFADDTLCSNTIKHKVDQKKLQKDLDSLTTWEKQWSMSFHPQKCYTLSVTRK